MRRQHACVCLHMQARALSVGRILFGFYQLPDSSAEPIDFVVNPEGMQMRSQQRCSPSFPGRPPLRPMRTFCYSSLQPHPALCRPPYCPHSDLHE